MTNLSQSLWWPKSLKRGSLVDRQTVGSSFFFFFFNVGGGFVLFLMAHDNTMNEPPKHYAMHEFITTLHVPLLQTC